MVMMMFDNKKMKVSALAIMMLLFSYGASALEISAMFLIADKSDEAVFTLTNTEKKRVYMNALISKINVKNGSLVSEPYTRENIQDWALEVRPSRTIINAGFKKDFVVSRTKGKDSQEDEVYKISFVPTPYNDELEDNMVQMAIGFGAIVLFPGAEQPLDYEVSYDGTHVTIINHTDTFFKSTVSACNEKTPKEELDDCKQSLYVLGGRARSIPLKDGLKHQRSLNWVASTANDLYKDSRRLMNKG